MPVLRKFTTIGETKRLVIHCGTSSKEGSIKVSISTKRIYLTLRRNHKIISTGLDNQKAKVVQREEQRWIHRITHYPVPLACRF